MKTILNLFALCFFFTVTQSTAQNSDSNAELESRLAEHTIDGVTLGTLMCEDGNGDMIICTGDEFEKVLGFATSTPYVTVNKRPKNQNQDTFSGYASMEAGIVSIGDYVCPSKEGKLKRCEKIDMPYARAISSASSENSELLVRILGSRR